MPVGTAADDVRLASCLPGHDEDAVDESARVVTTIGLSRWSSSAETGVDRRVRHRVSAGDDL
jgi:hypothetical protein